MSNSSRHSGPGGALPHAGGGEPPPWKGTVCQKGKVYAGQYRVEELLGEGGMGEVYLVQHLTLHAKFALKVLRPTYRIRDDIVARFRAESRALWELNHPNFVKVHHAGDDPEIGPYIVMEVLWGGTLAELYQHLGQLAIHQALPILIEAADTADAMHALGIIHRDLKPENIFVVRHEDKSRTIKLLDLGAAKITKYGQPATAENRTIGTGKYMSPEHIKCLPLSAASDIYSLGHIGYEILAGRHAFGAHHPTKPTHFDYQMWHLNADIEPLSDVLPGCPQDLWAVLAQAMAKKPEERFQSMAAFANAMREVLRRYLVARAKGGTEQMSMPRPDDADTIEQVLSSFAPTRPSSSTHPSGERERVVPTPTVLSATEEARTARKPVAEKTLEATPPSGGRGTQRMADAPARPELVAELVMIEGPTPGQPYPLPRGTFVVGREPVVDVYVNDASLSSRHGRVVVHPTGVIEVFDEQSLNGTRVNEVPTAYAVVKHGDRVRFGRVLFELRYLDPQRLSFPNQHTVRIEPPSARPFSQAPPAQALPVQGSDWAAAPVAPIAPPATQRTSPAYLHPTPPMGQSPVLAPPTLRAPPASRPPAKSSGGVVVLLVVVVLGALAGGAMLARSAGYLGLLPFRVVPSRAPTLPAEIKSTPRAWEV